MPIRYKKIRKTMEDVNKITQEEAKFIISVQPRYDFFQEEINKMLSIVKTYYDDNISGCMSCGSGIRAVKNGIINLYKQNKELIDNISNGTIILPLPIEELVVKTTKKKGK